MRTRFIKAACMLAPGLLTRYAYRQLTHPQWQKLRMHEQEVMDTAEKTSYPFQGFQIQLYHWPGEGKRVLLAHGWEGQAANFSDLILRFREAGYAVYAFDGPAHGLSSTGKTSMFEFADLTKALVQELQPHYAVSHSFGGVAITSALSQLTDFTLEKYVLLTTPDRFLERIDWVATQNGITEGVKNRLLRRIQQETGQDPARMNVSDYVKQTRVGKVLIVHDKGDRVISIEQSRNVQQQWPGCTLLEVEQTGHFKILRTPFVLDTVLDFFKTA